MVATSSQRSPASTRDGRRRRYVESLRRLVSRDEEKREDVHGVDARATSRLRIRLAFVYPGLGNQFAGMGRARPLWPAVLDGRTRKTTICGAIRSAFGGTTNCHARSPTIATPSSAVFGRHPGDRRASRPRRRARRGHRVQSGRIRSVGRLQSLDRTATRCCADYGHRPCSKRSWPVLAMPPAGLGNPARRPVDWVAGIVPHSAEAVRTAIAEHRESRVYVLIRNTAEETVIGGQRKAVDEVVRHSGARSLELPTVSTVHCEIGRTVETDTARLTTSRRPHPRGSIFTAGTGDAPTRRPPDGGRRDHGPGVGDIDFPRTRTLMTTVSLFSKWARAPRAPG